MEKLDSLVTESLVEQLFHSERLAALLTSVSERRVRKALEVNRRVAALQAEVADAKERLVRLYKMVEDGTEVDDVSRGDWPL